MIMIMTFVLYDIEQVDLDISKLSKGGYDHFMLNETYEQSDCLHDCMNGRLFVDKYLPIYMQKRIFITND